MASPGTTLQQASATRVPELDGVRGLAMSLVLVWHYLVGQVQSEPGSPVAYAMRTLSFTWAGVDLFFVLSGFLIGGILMDNAGAPHFFRSFFVRRAARIIPLYLVVLMLFGCAVAVGADQFGPGFLWLFHDPLPFWTYATYTQNCAMALSGAFGPHWMGVTWSLAVEEQFYLVLPLMIRFTNRRKLPGLLMCLILVAPVSRTLLFHLAPLGGLAGYLLLPTRWDSLFLGVLGAWLLRDLRWARWLTERLWFLRTVVAISALVLAFLLWANQGIGSQWMAYLGHTVLGLLGLAAILLGLLHPGAFQRLFRNPLLGRAGGISYGIYLFHQPVSGLLHEVLLSQRPQIGQARDLAVTALALALTILLAQVSWTVFERRIVNLGRRATYA